MKAVYTYDYRNRRVRKLLYCYSSGQWSPTSIEDTILLYDGWLRVMMWQDNTGMGTTDFNRAYTWGLDLAGLNGETGSIGVPPVHSGSKGVLPVDSGSIGVSPVDSGSVGVSPVNSGSIGVSPVGRESAGGVGRLQARLEEPAASHRTPHVPGSVRSRCTELGLWCPLDERRPES